MSNPMVWIANDNRENILKKLDEGIKAGLEACGMYAESRAIENLERAGRAGGALGQSIQHTVVQDGNVYYGVIGTDTEYAPYVEFGTGRYYPSGRKTPWHYQDKKTGQWYTTIGMEASPFLKPALAEHANTYMQMIADGINGSL